VLVDSLIRHNGHNVFAKPEYCHQDNQCCVGSLSVLYWISFVANTASVVIQLLILYVKESSPHNDDDERHHPM